MIWMIQVNRSCSGSAASCPYGATFCLIWPFSSIWSWLSSTRSPMFSQVAFAIAGYVPRDSSLAFLFSLFVVVVILDCYFWQFSKLTHHSLGAQTRFLSEVQIPLCHLLGTLLHIFRSRAILGKSVGLHWIWPRDSIKDSWLSWRGFSWNLGVRCRSWRPRIGADMGSDAAVGRTGDCHTETCRNTNVHHIHHSALDLFGGTRTHVGSPRHRNRNALFSFYHIWCHVCNICLALMMWSWKTQPFLSWCIPIPSVDNLVWSDQVNPNQLMMCCVHPSNQPNWIHHEYWLVLIDFDWWWWWSGGAEGDPSAEYHGQLGYFLAALEADLHGYGSVVSRHLPRVLSARTHHSSLLLFFLGRRHSTLPVL